MSKHDEKVKALLGTLEEKKQALGKKPSQVLRTNGLIKFKDNTHININTINDIDCAIESLASIFSKKITYDETCKALGVEDRVFTYCGHPIEDWIVDLKFRIDVIKWNAKLAEFNLISKKLDGLISEDLRTEKELGDIESLLSK